jgi:hypothetical protein
MLIYYSGTGIRVGKELPVGEEASLEVLPVDGASLMLSFHFIRSEQLLQDKRFALLVENRK